MGVERCRWIRAPTGSQHGGSKIGFLSGSGKEMCISITAVNEGTEMPTRDSMRDRSVEYSKNACGIQRSKSKITVGSDAPTRVEDGVDDIILADRKSWRRLKLGPS